MQNSRRGFLKLIGAAPAAPIAAKLAREAEIAGLGSSYGPMAVPSPAIPSASKAQITSFLRIPANRKMFESLIWDRHRGRPVGPIDHDIAAMRSFSLSAKIAYQRQRNVEREMEEAETESPWMKIDEFLNKARGLLG